MKKKRIDLGFTHGRIVNHCYDLGEGRDTLKDWMDYIFPEYRVCVHSRIPATIYTERGGEGKPLNVNGARIEDIDLIVKFDAPAFYQSPTRMLMDRDQDWKLHQLGYNIIHIPFFVTMTKTNIQYFFQREVDTPCEIKSGWRYEDMGDDILECMPASFCVEGLERFTSVMDQLPRETQMDIIESIEIQMANLPHSVVLPPKITRPLSKFRPTYDIRHVTRKERNENG